MIYHYHRRDAFDGLPEQSKAAQHGKWYELSSRSVERVIRVHIVDGFRKVQLPPLVHLRCSCCFIFKEQQLYCLQHGPHELHRQFFFVKIVEKSAERGELCLELLDNTVEDIVHHALDFSLCNDIVCCLIPSIEYNLGLRPRQLEKK